MISSSSSDPGHEPIKAELFSVEQLDQHARSLGEAQETVRREGLITRPLSDTGSVLLSSYKELAPATREEALLSMEGELIVVDGSRTGQIAAVRCRGSAMSRRAVGGLGLAARPDDLDCPGQATGLPQLPVGWTEKIRS